MVRLIINILPTDIANHIAAGEVIERPSSAVKELVENALDAYCQNIEIHITGGGLTLIRVTDDGQGMDEADLRLCLLRHATSKLQTLDDLFNIRTLGFRGEALPSIAAVSKMTVQSRTKSAVYGHELRNSGGVHLALSPIGMPHGTTIEVNELFFNTPARLKFMKSASSEGQKILQIVERLAMSHPNVRFTLHVEGKVVLQTLGRASLIDTALSIYGANLAAQVYAFGPIRSRSLTLSGVLALPVLHRHNRMWQSIFLNNRYIENKRLSAILDQAYRTLLPSKRYPVAILHLTVPAEEVDVNVHPTKVEVRFRDEKAICGEFMTILRQQLQLMADRQVGRNSATSSSASPMLRPAFFDSEAFAYTGQSPVPVKTSQLTLLLATAAYRLIGQVCLSYILLERDGKLVIVDQHAAHERILWEQFMTKSQVVQNLAVPMTIDFGPLVHFLPAYLPQLLGQGFLLEHFGGNTYLLRSLPSTYLGHFDAETLKEVVSDLESDTASDRDEVLAARLACRAALKAGTRLSPSEMVELLDRLYSSVLPFTCPHGRPIEIAFAEAELFKLFHPK